MPRLLELALIMALALPACAGHQVLHFDSQVSEARVRIQREGSTVADERTLPARYELSYPSKVGPWALGISGGMLVTAGLSTVLYSVADDSAARGFETLAYGPLLGVGSLLLASGLIWGATQPSKRFQVTVESSASRDVRWLELPARGQEGDEEVRFFFDGTRLRSSSDEPAP